MDEPNLQTVPKPRDFKVLLPSAEQEGAGSQHSPHATRTSNLRAAFVAPPGFVLLSGARAGNSHLPSRAHCAAVRRAAQSGCCQTNSCFFAVFSSLPQPTTARSSSG